MLSLRLVLAAGAAVVLVVATTGMARAQSTTTTSTAGPVRGVSDTKVTVGGLGHALLYGGADVGARARFQRANDTGGVNGRTIDYRGFTDDGGDATANTAAAAKLVAQEGVFAVVPVVAPDLAASSFLVDQKVPYFGWALSSSFCGNRFGFGFAGCPVPESATSNVWPLLVSKVLAGDAPGRNVAVLAENTSSGKYDVRSLTAAATSVNLHVVYAKAALGTPVTPDYDAIVKEVFSSNGGSPPDAVFVVGNPSNVLGLRQALTANGYRGLFTDQLEYAPSFVATAVNALVLTHTAPIETKPTNPAMQQLTADVQKVAPNRPIDQAVVAGYWSADLFLQALARAGKRLTAASLVKAANRRFTYEVPDTVGPTIFPAAHSLPTPCGALVMSNGTAYTVKVPYTCGRVVRVR